MYRGSQHEVGSRRPTGIVRTASAAENRCRPSAGGYPEPKAPPWLHQADEKARLGRCCFSLILPPGGLTHQLVARSPTQKLQLVCQHLWKQRIEVRIEMVGVDLDHLHIRIADTPNLV